MTYYSNGFVDTVNNCRKRLRILRPSDLGDNSVIFEHINKTGVTKAPNELTSEMTATHSVSTPLKGNPSRFHPASVVSGGFLTSATLASRFHPPHVSVQLFFFLTFSRLFISPQRARWITISAGGHANPLNLPPRSSTFFPALINRGAERCDYVCTL